jgi:uncharacterized protein (DUF2147 family)
MWTLLAFALLALVSPSAAAGSGEALEGRWLTQGQSAVVEIYGCGDGAVCGRLLWFRMKPVDREHNPQVADIHNPDPALRGRPLCGLTIMRGFRANGPDHWEGGSLYDPESGHTYTGRISLNPDGTLNLRGYVGIPLFGRSEQWTRFTQRIGRCPGE